MFLAEWYWKIFWVWPYIVIEAVVIWTWEVNVWIYWTAPFWVFTKIYDITTSTIELILSWFS